MISQVLANKFEGNGVRGEFCVINDVKMIVLLTMAWHVHSQVSRTTQNSFLAHSLAHDDIVTAEPTHTVL